MLERVAQRKTADDRPALVKDIVRPEVDRGMVRRHAELQILSPRFQIVEGLLDDGWHARRVNVVSAVAGTDETNLVVANLAHLVQCATHHRPGQQPFERLAVHPRNGRAPKIAASVLAAWW